MLYRFASHCRYDVTFLSFSLSSKRNHPHKNGSEAKSQDRQSRDVNIPTAKLHCHIVFKGIFHLETPMMDVDQLPLNIL